MAKKSRGEEVDVSATKKKKKSSAAPEKKKKKRSKEEKILSPKQKEKEKNKQKKAEKKLEKKRQQIALLENEAQSLILYEDADLGSGEKEYLAEYQNMFNSLSAISRALESRMLSSDSGVTSKDVYALSTNYSQMRECINDMRSIKDSGEQAQEIIRELLEPMAKGFGEIIVGVYFELVQTIKDSAPEAQVQDLLMRVQQIIATTGSKTQAVVDTSKDKVQDIMNPARR